MDLDTFVSIIMPYSTTFQERRTCVCEILELIAYLSKSTHHPTKKKNHEM